MQDTQIENPLKSNKILETYTGSHTLKNLVILSFGGLLFFTSYDGLLVLQSTINGKEGIGTTSLAIQFACSCVSSLLLPKYLITKFGSKNVIIMSMLSLMPFIASNFYPKWLLMVGSSIIIGIGWPLLWGSQCSHLNYLSQLYTVHLSSSKENGLGEFLDGNEPEITFEQFSGCCNSNFHSTSPDSVSSNDLTTKPENGIVCFPKTGNSTYPQKLDTSTDYDTYSIRGNDHNGSKDGQIILNPNNVIRESTIESNIGHKHREIPKLEPFNDNSSCNSKNFLANHVKSTLEFQTVPLETNDNPKQHSSKPVLPKVAEKASVLESTTARFFGFHSMMYQSCYVWSNLLSFYVLKSDSYEQNFISNSSCACGADFCNVESACTAHNLQPPSTEVRYILLSVFCVLNVLAMLLLLCFLDQVKESNRNVSMSLEMLLATCRRSKERNQFLLIPLTIYIGMGQGFYIGDFTKSYIGCAWGVQHVGLVTICSGITMAMASSLSGWFVKHLGRLPIFLLAEIVNVVMSIILIIWKPDSRQPIMFFVASGLWGLLFGTLWSQLRAFYGVLFKNDEEAAFGSYQFWHSMGSCLSLSYSNSICTIYKIYILISISSAGIVGYLLVERSYSRKKDRKGFKT